MPIVRSPCTLECPRIGHAPAPGRPMLPRRSRKFITSRIVATALRCWVRPIVQHAMIEPAPRTRSTNCSTSSRPRPAAGEQGVRVGRGPRGCRGLEPLGVLVEEVAVDGAELDEPAVHVGHQREVAVEPHLQVLCGQRGAAAQHARDPLRVAEPDQPRLGQRVDDHDLGTAAGGLLQRDQHPRVVGARVRAEDHDQVGVVAEVLEADAALADADRLAQRDAGGLVAQVRAVGQVVRAAAGGRGAGRGTPPRCWCGPRCRTPPRRGRPARAGAPRRSSIAPSQVIGV